MTAAELWEIYFPGRTPGQVYWDARREQEERGELHREAIRPSYPTTMLQARQERERITAAWTELRRHDGVPNRWIDRHGQIVAPVQVCRWCWETDADSVDRIDGRRVGYHMACRRAAEIRCDLRCAASSRILWGDEVRARMWEQRALESHLQQVNA